MEPNARFRKAVRGFYAWLGATLLAALAPLAANRLVDSGSVAARVSGVALGTLAWLPLIYVVARIIRDGDEFVRRIHLVALALAFTGGLMLIALLDWLVRAEFIATPPLNVLWLAIALLWAVSLFGAKRYYERPQ